MSAWAERRAEPTAVQWGDSEEGVGPLWVRLIVFFAVTTLSALAYERLLREPPAGTAVAVAAAATVCGAALALGMAAVGRVRPGERSRSRLRAARAAVAVVAALLGIELGLLAVGVPVRLLAPWHWGSLASAVEGGLGSLGAWNWPYLGTSHWARLGVLMLLVPATTAMALLFFWPARSGAAGRRLCGLAIAVALALCGMTNSPGGGWRVEGLLLVLVVFAWLWLPTMRRPDAGRALRWTVACAAGGLILAPFVSGSHSWISFAANEGANPTQFQWDQLYGPTGGPHSHNPTLLNVRATADPGLLRVTSLDRFDGLRFIRSDSPPDTVAGDVPASPESRAYQTATITIAGLRSSLLVGTSGITTHVDFRNRAPSLQRKPDGTLSLPAPLAPGNSYTVTSYAPKPAPARMAAAPATFPASYIPYTEFELPQPSASALNSPQLEQEASSPPRQAQLVRAPVLGTGAAGATGATAGAPALTTRILGSPYGPAYSLARHLGAGAGSAYEVVARVERYLLSGRYTYDERPPLGRYPLEAFLFETRRGFCEQFSGAMTLLLRMDGIPARVGVGFKPALVGGVATPTFTGLMWTANALQAHAWVEVFFSGIGWVTFDPTPGSNGSSTVAGGTGLEGLLLPATQNPADPHGSSASNSQLPSYLAETLTATRPHRHAHRAGAAGPPVWEWALLALIVVAGIAGALRVRGARGRARTADPGGLDPAVRELERALEGSAWPLLPGMTLTEIAHRFERSSQPQAAAYVRRLRDRRFGRARTLTGPELAAARTERLALRRALARRKGLRGRLRALRLLPPRSPAL